MEKVFLQLVNMSIQASYLMLAVIIARFFLRKAPKYMSCFLWILVGIRLICPISIESVFSLIPNQQSIDQSVTLGQNSNIEVNFTNQSGKTESDLTMEKAEAVLPITAADSTSENIIIAILLTIVWIIGMVILFIYSVWSYLRLKRKVATATPRELNGSKVYECEEINSPFLLGIIRPSIYIPIDIAEKDLSYVIAHEKVHIVRRDYLIKPIAYLFLVIYWFHPLVFISYVLLCRDIELACDEKVIRELGNDCKKEYSQALLACSIGRKSIADCPVAFGEVGVKQRIKNVLNYRKPTFWMIILAGIVCIVISVCFMTQKKEDGISDREIAENTSGNNISDQETSDNNAYGDNISDNHTSNNNTSDNNTDDMSWQNSQLSTDGFAEVLWQWEEAVSANPKEEMLNQNSGSEKMDGINLLTANEEYNMYLYGLYTKEYGYRGLYFLVDGDLNAMDISWQSMSFGGSENVIRILERAENQKPRMFSFIMPDFNTSSSEIWRLFIVDRYDTGTLEMTEFQKEDCFKQAEELVDSTVEEGRLKISSKGQILYDMPLPEGVSDGAISVFMNNLMSFEANDTNIICHLVIGLQDENEISIGGRPPISFVVDYGDFGQHEIKLKKAYIDDTMVVKEPNRG